MKAANTMNATTPPSDLCNGTWARHAEAAAALGISPSTLHRRIAAKQLQVKREHGRVLVWLATPSHQTTATVTPRTEHRDDQPMHRVTTPGETQATLQRDTSDNKPPQDQEDVVLVEHHEIGNITALTATIKQAIRVLERALEAERHRADEAAARVREVEMHLRHVEQAAAMHQERAHQYERETERLREQLTLPAPPSTEVPPPIDKEKKTRWWTFRWIVED